MGPIKAIATCFKKYACPKGRARRSEYWWFFGFYIIFLIIAGFSLGVASVDYPWLEANFPYVTTVLVALFISPLVGVAIRRAHDTGRSGWLMLVPVYNIVILFLPSDPDDNLWGPSHLSIDISDEINEGYQYSSDWGPFIVLAIIGLLALGVQLDKELKETQSSSIDYRMDYPGLPGLDGND